MTNEIVRRLRLRQGRRNESERREIVRAIAGEITGNPWVDVVDMTLRTEYEGRTVFKALHIRKSEHFPYIVPELVSENGDYMLISWLTYGSLVRLLNAVR